MITRNELLRRLISAKDNAKRKKIKVESYTRLSYSTPRSLGRVNQAFKAEATILSLAKSIKVNGSNKTDYIIVAMLQDALNNLRKEL